MGKLEELINKLCPNGVEFKTLGELGKFYGGLTGKSKEDFNKGNAKFITYKNVYENLSLKIDVEDRVNIGENEKQRTLEYGDIIFTGSSETSDECGISSVLTQKTEEKLYLNSFCFFLRLNDKNLLNPDFTKHLFRSSNLRYQIGKTASGVTRFNVSKKAMEKVCIPVPPLEVQCEIVRILDNFTLLSAELSTLLSTELKARQKQFSYYREKLYKSNENIKRLDEVVDIRLGLTHTPKYVENGIKFISAQNTSNDYLNLDHVKYISQKEYDSITDNAKPKRGDILFTRVGSNLGHPVIVETDEKLCMFVSLGYLRIKNTNSVLNTYIKHWINTENFWSQVRKNVHGSAKVNLNTGWLSKFEISIPSIKEQQNIVNILDKFEKLCNDISDDLPAEIEVRKKQYEFYRDKLLTFKELKS